MVTRQWYSNSGAMVQAARHKAKSQVLLVGPWERPSLTWRWWRWRRSLLQWWLQWWWQCNDDVSYGGITWSLHHSHMICWWAQDRLMRSPAFLHFRAARPTNLSVCGTAMVNCWCGLWCKCDGCPTVMHWWWIMWCMRRASIFWRSKISNPKSAFQLYD